MLGAVLFVYRVNELFSKHSNEINDCQFTTDISESSLSAFLHVLYRFQNSKLENIYFPFCGK